MPSHLPQREGQIREAIPEQLWCRCGGEEASSWPSGLVRSLSHRVSCSVWGRHHNISPPPQSSKASGGGAQAHPRTPEHKKSLQHAWPSSAPQRFWRWGCLFWTSCPSSDGCSSWLQRSPVSCMAFLLLPLRTAQEGWERGHLGDSSRRLGLASQAVSACPVITDRLETLCLLMPVERRKMPLARCCGGCSRWNACTSSWSSGHESAQTRACCQSPLAPRGISTAEWRLVCPSSCSSCRKRLSESMKTFSFNDHRK